MRERLLLGPVLVLLLVLGLWLDEYLDDQPLPERLTALGDGLGVSVQTFPPGVVVLPIVLLLSVLAAREMAGIFKSKGLLASRRMHSLAAIAGLLVSCLVPSGVDAVTAVGVVASAAVAVLVSALLYHSRHASYEGIVAAAGGVALSFVYLGLAFGFILAIRRGHSAWTLLYLLALVKGCDTGAYFVGTAWGRRKLIPWLSPGKTWEGLIGGAVVAAGLGAVGAWILTRWDDGAGALRLSPAVGAVLGGVLGILGQVGDLLVSLLKRDAHQKDSGHLLPGFGGVLDLLDSPLLAAPAAFWLLAAVS
jgi:phosphatidate cytidylyltransferase